MKTNMCGDNEGESDKEKENEGHGVLCKRFEALRRITRSCCISLTILRKRKKIKYD